MLIIALGLAVIGLAALVTAVVTSNEMIAWVCIGASVIGVVLLIVDALRERSRGTRAAGEPEAQDAENSEPAAAVGASEVTDVHEPVDYPEEPLAESDPDGTEGDDADAVVDSPEHQEHKN